MPLEAASTIEGLFVLWPLGDDPVLEGDDHLRLIKAVLKAQFPGTAGQGFAIPITSTEAEINHLVGVTSGLQQQLDIRLGIWSTSVSYPINAYVIAANDLLYRSTIANSSINPIGDVTGTWDLFPLDATETDKGQALLATSADAIAGTDDAKIMTALKTRQSLPESDFTTQGIVELATNAEATTGIDDTRAVTPGSMTAAINSKSMFQRTVLHSGDTTGTASLSQPYTDFDMIHVEILDTVENGTFWMSVPAADIVLDRDYKNNMKLGGDSNGGAGFDFPNVNQCRRVNAGTLRKVVGVKFATV